MMLEVQRKRAWRKKREEKKKVREGEGEDNGSQTSLSLFLSFFPSYNHTHTHTHAASFRLSVSYINLPVNPSDLNDPSTAAAAPRDGGRDKHVR